MSYQSAKGYRGEHDLELYLCSQGLVCWRPRTTSYRATDIGDLKGQPLVLSVKNHNRLALASAVDEMAAMVERSPWDTGLLLHKRVRKGSPGQWYATTTVDLALPLLDAYIIGKARSQT